MSNENKTKKEASAHSAPQRVAAVLAVWTERRTSAQVCKEMSIHQSLLNQWQHRAIAGLLSALTPRGRRHPEQAPALSPKLARLLGKQAARQQERVAKLEKRLARIAEAPTATATASAS